MIDSPLLMVPGPTGIPARIMAAMSRPMMNHRGPAFRNLYQRILENLKYAFQTKNDVYPLTCSGTGGVEFAVGNLISRGDKVLTIVSGLFGERMREAIVRYGGDPVTLESEWGSAPTTQKIEAALESGKDVKAIALVYNETSTGVTLRDLPAIGKIARKRDLFLIVDGISILGGDYLPIDEWNIDMCIAGSQKCLACPPGISMVSVSERAYEAAAKNNQRPFYFDLISHREFKGKMETPFTPAVSLFYALDEALIWLKEETLERRIERHKACAEAFYRSFERAGLKFVAEKGLRSHTTIAVYTPEGVEDAKLREVMRGKYGVIVGGGAGKLKGKTFRIGSMGAVSTPQVLTTVRAVLMALKDLGYQSQTSLDNILSEVKHNLPPLPTFL
ncbi:MAG: alanine--glyoxylate aminotransferase family protein [Candidatus Bathyarchaeia archaeon]